MPGWALLLALLASGAQGLEYDWWVAADGAVLREAVWLPEGERRGTLVVLPGHQEFAEKYEELAEWATYRNWEVRFLEWRGQGLSDRVLEDRQKAHHRNSAIPARDLADWLDARGEGLVRPMIMEADENRQRVLQQAPARVQRSLWLMWVPRGALYAAQVA